MPKGVSGRSGAGIFAEMVGANWDVIGIYKGQYRNKKDLMQHGECVLHKVFHFRFLWVSQNV